MKKDTEQDRWSCQVRCPWSTITSITWTGAVRVN